MSQTITPAHDDKPSARRSQGLLLVAVAATASLLTAAVMGGNRADMGAPQRAVMHSPPTAAGVGTPDRSGTDTADAPAASAGPDFPQQDPAPTF